MQHEGGTHTKVGVLLDSVTCRHTVLIFAMIDQNPQVVQNGVTAQCIALVLAGVDACTRVHASGAQPTCAAACGRLQR